MQTLDNAISLIGNLSTLFVLCGAAFTVYLFLKGILRVWWRLGLGLSRRKIAVFADQEFGELRSLLVESGLFQDKNVIQITKSALKRAQAYDMFLVHWKAFANEIDEILKMKDNSTALIVYAPQSEGFIDKPLMEKISAERNAIVVNLRGRLLNDVLVSMITTGYKAK